MQNEQKYCFSHKRPALAALLCSWGRPCGHQCPPGTHNLAICGKRDASARRWDSHRIFRTQNHPERVCSAGGTMGLRISQPRCAGRGSTGAYWETFFHKVEEQIAAGKAPDLSRLRMPIIGGEGTTPEKLAWMDSLLQRCGGQQVLSGYGLSEAFSIRRRVFCPGAGPCVGMDLRCPRSVHRWRCDSCAHPVG